MTLYHFSEESGLRSFDPRPVRVPSPRTAGQAWLNGPLVWAIDEWHQPLYLFPRDCPRILAWRREGSTAADIAEYFAGADTRMVAFIERRWLERVRTTSLYRYRLPAHGFESLADAGMWVSRASVRPEGVTELQDLPARLIEAGVTLRVLDELTPLRGAWHSSLQVSGLRLRNARGWQVEAAPADRA